MNRVAFALVVSLAGFPAALFAQKPAAVELKAKGDRLLSEGAKGEAEAAYRAAIEADAGFFDAYWALSAFYLREAQHEKAASLLRVAVKRSPGYAEGWYNLAYALRKTGDLDGAIEAYRNYGKLRPTSADPHYGLALALKAKGDLREAASSFRKYAGLERSPEKRSWIKKALEEANRLDAEAGKLERAARAGKGAKGETGEAGEATGDHLEKPAPKPAAKPVAKSAPKPEEKKSPPRAASPAAGDGTMPMELKTGESEAQGSGPLGPGQKKALDLKREGARLARAGQFERAIERYREAIAADYGCVSAYIELGNALFALKRYDEAVRTFRVAIRDNPDFNLGWYNLAFGLRKAGRNEEAIAAYRKFIQLKPEDPDPHFGLALAYLSLGRKAEAARAYQAYVDKERRPQQRIWIQKAKAEIARLEGRPPPAARDEGESAAEGSHGTEEKGEEKAAPTKTKAELAADAKKAAADGQKQKAEEEKRQKEEARKLAADEKKRQADEKKQKLEEQRKQKEEAHRIAAEARKLAADEKRRQADEQRQKVEGERREREEAKKAEADAKKAAADGQKQKAEEEKRQKEEARRAAAEAKKKPKPEEASAGAGAGGAVEEHAGEAEVKVAPAPSAPVAPSIPAAPQASPGDSEGVRLRVQADTLARLGKCAQAFPLYRDAIAKSPFEIAAYDGVAHCAFKLGQAYEGSKLIAIGLRDNPEFTRGWLHLARLQRAARQEERAVGSYRKYLATQGADTAARFELARALRTLGMKQEAIAAYAEFLKSEGRRADVAPELAAARLELAALGGVPAPPPPEKPKTKAELAREAKQRAAEERRGKEETRKLAAEEKKRKAEEDKLAREAAKKLGAEEKKRKAEEDKLARAEAKRLAAEGKKGAGAAGSGAADGGTPGAAPAREEGSGLRADLARRIADSATPPPAAVSSHDEPGETPEAARALAEVAEEQFAKGRYLLAMGLYQQAAKLEPADAELAFRAGLAALAANQMGLAVDFFSRVLKLDPQNRMAKASLGLAKTAVKKPTTPPAKGAAAAPSLDAARQAYGAKKYAETEKLLDALIKRKASSQLLHLRAEARLAQGKAQQALDDAGGAFTLDPKDIDALRLMGDAHLAGNERNRALAYYREYLKRLPKGAATAAKRAKIEKLVKELGGR
jgi:tetratricopeptide (TPR) repeat protein